MESVASVSIDLDDKWSYLRIRGLPGWQEFPSFLNIAVPRILEFANSYGAALTIFVVGQDADLPSNGRTMKELGKSVHEIGNHSYHHESWLHLKSDREIHDEILLADSAIQRATGRSPEGFRGPGYSLSPSVLSALHNSGYRYDASILPTFIGPLARLFYMRTIDKRVLGAEDTASRRRLFGRVRDGLWPNEPFVWQIGSGTHLIEIPITTMPILRLPIHATYLFKIASLSEKAASSYLRLALSLCRRFRLRPSFLLHAIDFLGSDDVTGLDFFPSMDLQGAAKRRLLSFYIDSICDHYSLVPLHDLSSRIQSDQLERHLATALR